ncbi:MAG: hypothetical protein K0R80_1585 [Clostridia bacterium]|jgi:hypothetical protein|nr:hypothetical protein [Clostridia bacterium]
MKNNISREKVILLCLIIAIFVLVGGIAKEQVRIEKLEEQLANRPLVEAPKIIFGEYTLIHYPNGGWINAIYITEYYKIGQDLFYKEKGSTVFKPIWFPSILPVDGWVEGDALTDYGYWIPELNFE